MGIIATILGYERDSYYEGFASNHLRIGMSVKQPLKKTFHRLNFLSIKSIGDALKGTGDFTGADGRIQTPFEVVTGLHLGNDWVQYRFFVSCGAEDNGEFENIKNVVLQGQQHYNLTLGTANFMGWIKNVRMISDVESKTDTDFVLLHSAIPSSVIQALNFPQDDDNFLEEELLPADFIGNGNRELSKLVRVLFSTRGIPFSAKLNVPFFCVPDEHGLMQNILFIE
jgi:CRISPR-associated protein Cas5h